MPLVIALLTGIAVGAFIGWFWATSKSNSEFSDYRVQAEVTAAATAAALRTKQAELGSELEERTKELVHAKDQWRAESEQRAVAQSELKQAKATLNELSSVRDRLGAEGQLRVAAEMKLRETEINLREQKKLLDEAAARLADTSGR